MTLLQKIISIDVFNLISLKISKFSCASNTLNVLMVGSISVFDLVEARWLVVTFPINVIVVQDAVKKFSFLMVAWISFKCLWV